MRRSIEDTSIVFIGAGNLATNLAKALYDNGFRIIQVYSRTEESARALAQVVEATYTTDLSSVVTDAQLYIVSLKDAAFVQLLPEIVAFVARLRHRRRGTRGRGRRGAALHAGIHVRLIVVADVEHIVIAVEHAGEAAHADIGGAAVTALGDHADRGLPVLLRTDPIGRSHTGRDSRRIAEERMQPRHSPGAFRIRRREDFQAPGGIRHGDPAVGFFHRRVQRVAGAEGLAAALAGAVSRFQRIEALGRALQCLQLLIQKPITNRKGAGLIKMDS